MKITLVNPTLEQVNQFFASQLAIANYRAKTRTVEEFVITPKEWEAPTQAYDSDGWDGVANAYKGVATGTIAAIAWVTLDTPFADEKIRTVTLYCERATLRKGRIHSRGFGLTQKQWDKAEIIDLVDFTDLRESLGLREDTPLNMVIDAARDAGLPDRKLPEPDKLILV